MTAFERPIIPVWLRPGGAPAVLAFIFSLFIYGVAFPYGAPLNVPIIFFALVWFSFVKRTVALPTNTGFVLLVAAFLLQIITLIHTGRTFETTMVQFRNAIAVMMLSLILFSLRTRKEFEAFRNRALIYGAVSGTTLAVVGLYKFHLMAKGQTIAKIWIEGYPYPWGTSLIVDYNFFAFAMLAGAISCLFCVSRTSSTFTKAICIIAFGLNTVSMSLSGSRRGWVTEALLLVVVCVLLIRWLGVTLLPLLSRRLQASERGVKSIAALILVLLLCPIVIRNLHPAFLDSNREDFQAQTEDLRMRFESLADPNHSFAARTKRWDFTASLLNNSSPSELIFGQGSDYIRRIASEFDAEHLEDYPHNPLMSATLGSGIVGGLVILSFFAYSTVLYAKQYKTDFYFATLYFASLWFIFIAFDSIFSSKFFAFLLLIPCAMAKAMSRGSDATSPGYCSEFVYSRFPGNETTGYAVEGGI